MLMATIPQYESEEEGKEKVKELKTVDEVGAFLGLSNFEQ
jgi:hypothetical protein